MIDVKVDINDNIIEYPTTREAIRGEHPDISFPSTISDQLASEYGYYPVELSNQPSYDTITEEVVESNPQLIAGVWTQQWTVQALPAEIQAANQRIVDQSTGFDYNGNTIPLFSSDAVAMLQVKAAFELGATSTNIEFSNGVVLPITSTEFPTFAQQFVAARNALFGGT